MKSQFTLFCFLTGICAGLTPTVMPVKASAQVHAHGVSLLQAALDGKTLIIELTAPGKDIVGFEYEPTSTNDKKRYKKIRAILIAADKMFALNPAAACRGATVEVLEELWEDHDHHKGHRKKHAHKKSDRDQDKHDHSEQKGKQEHGEFRLRYRYECQDAARLQSLTVKAYQSIANLRTIDFQFVGPKGQIAARLSRQKSSIAFNK